MKRIIIDTDMWPDDYIAVQLAALSKKIKLEGISLVCGNTNIKSVKRKLLKALDMINMLGKFKIYEVQSNELNKDTFDSNYSVPVSKDLSDTEYDDANGKIEDTNAIDWMIDLVNNNPRKIIVVAIGPLTNIAKAILKDQHFVKNIKQLIIMGGAENFGNITPYAEFNFYEDPQAAKIVFESGIKDIKLIGFDVTKKVMFDETLEKMFINSEDENAKFIYSITRDTAKLDREENKVDGAIISDAVNICYLLNKRSLKFKKAFVEIETTDSVRIGESKVYYNKKFNCEIAMDVDAKLCKKIIFNTICPKVMKSKNISRK